MKGKITVLDISPERMRVVISDIRAGSKPRIGFYFLLVVATWIACMGLAANSTAVIIGAMLVSPLMTPIFGIALAVLRGHPALLWSAVRAEVIGIAAAVGVAFLFGLLPITIEATPEMLFRTEPHLLDLMVAVLAGCAGAYALLDERLSPALPGVAIATAIVPPLANTGLCLALGAYEGAAGSFMLFFANFIAILLVGLVMFAAVGMARADLETKLQAVRRYGPSVLTFVVVALILTPSLLRMVENRKIDKAVREVATAWLSDSSAVALVDYAHSLEDERLDVFVTVRTDEPLTPKQVTKLETALRERLGGTVSVLVRNQLGKDVASVGSELQAAKPDLDGNLTQAVLSPVERQARVGQQVMLEELALKPGVRLERVQYAFSGILLAEITSVRPISGDEIRGWQSAIRSRLENPGIQLVVQVSEPKFQTAEEHFLVGWTNLRTLTSELESAVAELRRTVTEEVSRVPDLFCVGVHVNVRKEPWRLLVEVSGPSAPAPETVEKLEDAVAARSAVSIEINLLYRCEAVVATDGYAEYREFIEPELREWIRELPGILQEDER